MGHVDSKSKVLYSVRPNSVIVKESGVLPIARYDALTITEGRSKGSLEQRGHRNRTGPFKPRFLQQALLGYKEKRQTAPCYSLSPLKRMITVVHFQKRSGSISALLYTAKSSSSGLFLSELRLPLWCSQN